MNMATTGPRRQTFATVLGGAGLGAGLWRMARGRRDWLAWTMATAGTAKMVEGLTGWNMMRSAATLMPKDRGAWVRIARAVPATIKAWL